MPRCRPFSTCGPSPQRRKARALQNRLGAPGCSDEGSFSAVEGVLGVSTCLAGSALQPIFTQRSGDSTIGLPDCRLGPRATQSPTSARNTEQRLTGSPSSGAGGSVVIHLSDCPLSTRSSCASALHHGCPPRVIAPWILATRSTTSAGWRQHPSQCVNTQAPPARMSKAATTRSQRVAVWSRPGLASAAAAPTEVPATSSSSECPSP